MYDVSLGQKETRAQAAGSVLIVEDNQDDARLLHRELVLVGVRNPIQFVGNGEQFFSYVKGEGEYQDRDKFPYPILVMLDLRMSPRDGYDVLRWLRANPNYNTFPVLVVSVLEEQHKITEAYRLGAKTFLRKPITRRALKEALQGVNVLPSAESTEGPANLQHESPVKSNETGAGA
jgi:CheY-like chemotaxis protein